MTQFRVSASRDAIHFEWVEAVWGVGVGLEGAFAGIFGARAGTVIVIRMGFGGGGMFPAQPHERV